MLSDTIETLQELRRMHRLNHELLEQLAVACSFLVKNHLEIPNEETLVSLLKKAWALMDEIQVDQPKVLQYMVGHPTESNMEKNPTKRKQNHPSLCL
jgi:hypothetical protein